MIPFPFQAGQLGRRQVGVNALDPFFANVVSLLHFNGNDGGVTFTDNAPSPLTYSTSNAVSTFVSTAQSKFGGASAATTNSTRLNFSSSSDFAVGQVFTCELWVYPTSQQSKWLINNSLNGFQFGHQNSTSWGVAENGVAWRLTTTTLPTLNAWNHVAVSRNSSNVMKLFLNGAEVASATVTTAFTGAGTCSIFEMSGYCDELRLTKGVCRYTGSFTAPTAAFPDDVSGDADFASVVLLIHADGLNNSYKFTDKSTSAKLVITPSAFTDTSQSKFGSASAFFSAGTNTSIASATSPAALNLFPSDYTVEGYVRIQSLVAAYIFQFYNNNSNRWILEFNGSGLLQVTTVNSGTVVQQNTSQTLSVNTWYHFAVSRSGSTTKVFVEGVEVFSGTVTIPNVNPALVLGGAPPAGDTQKLIGWIDEVRVTKGTARYTAAFTPPTAQFPDA